MTPTDTWSSAVRIRPFSAALSLARSTLVINSWVNAVACSLFRNSSARIDSIATTRLSDIAPLESICTDKSPFANSREAPAKLFASPPRASISPRSWIDIQTRRAVWTTTNTAWTRTMPKPPADANTHTGWPVRCKRSEPKCKSAMTPAAVTSGTQCR